MADVRPDGSFDDLARRARAAAVAGGLDAVGIAPAATFASTRRHLERRKHAGLHGGMEFTYRNPARSTDPARTVPGARALLVGARSYRRRPPSRPVETGPVARVARYAWDDHYAALRAALGEGARVLEEAGYRTAVLADDNALVDREAAHRAGLGWYGKNANLLLPGAGSWFVLGSVVTDAPLRADPAPVADGCGGCRRCLDSCPTGAIVAPGVVDARRCLAWLVQQEGAFPRELRVSLGDRIYGCDDCQEVCPPNRASDRQPADPVVDPDRAWVPLLDLLDQTDGALLDRHGQWYIPRRDPRYLRRNALVALGNTGSASSAAVAATLVRYLADPDPLLRSHAVWAARRLGRDDLTTGLASDPDPDVRAEVTAGCVPERSAGCVPERSAGCVPERSNSL